MTDVDGVVYKIMVGMKPFGEIPLQIQEYLLTKITTALAEVRREVWGEALYLLQRFDGTYCKSEFRRRSRAP